MSKYFWAGVAVLLVAVPYMFYDDISRSNEFSAACLIKGGIAVKLNRQLVCVAGGILKVVK